MAKDIGNKKPINKKPMKVGDTLLIEHADGRITEHTLTEIGVAVWDYPYEILQVNAVFKWSPRIVKATDCITK